MSIDVDPYITQIGPFVVGWEGLFIGLALLVGIVHAARDLRSVGIDADLLYAASLWVIPAGIVGSRVFHVVDSWNYYAVHPLNIFAITRGGGAVYGAIVFGTATAFLFARRHRLPLGRFFDATGPAQVLGFAIGRIGDLITGAEIGRTTNLPFAVRYTSPASFGQRQLPVHPVAAYEIIWDLAAYAALLWLRRRGLPDGALFWTFTGLFALGQIWTGFFRVEAADAFGLGQAQLVGIVFLTLSIYALANIARHTLCSNR